MKKNLVIVDYSWVYHRSFYAYDLSYKVGDKEVKTGGMYGTIRDLDCIHRRFKDADIAVAMEPAHNKVRRDLHMAYKTGRKKHPEIYDLYYQTLEAVKLIPYVMCLTSDDDGEADDVIFTVATGSYLQYQNIYLHANDNDLLQLGENQEASEKILIVGKAGEVAVRHQCIAKYGVEPWQVLMYRSILGDKSDHIPPIKQRFSRALARHIAESFKTPADYYANALKVPENILSCRAAWENNYALMKLRQLTIRKAEPNKYDVKYFAEKYGMNSFHRLIKGEGYV